MASCLRIGQRVLRWVSSSVVACLVLATLVLAPIEAVPATAAAAPAGPASTTSETPASTAPTSLFPTAVELSIDKPTFATGEKVRLTARPNQDIRAHDTPYRVILVDRTAELYLGSCYRTSTSGGAVWDAETQACSISTSFLAGGPHVYEALVAQGATYDGVFDVQATSNEVSAERESWSVSLEIDRTVFATGEKVTLTATPSQRILSTGTPYRVLIVDETTDGLVALCLSNNSNGWDSERRSCSGTTSFGTAPATVDS